MTNLALRMLEAEMPITLVAFAQWQETNSGISHALEEYLHFHKLSMALPDAELALEQAEYVAMPADPKVQYHFSAMLARTVTKETLPALVTLCNTMVPELAVRTMLLATQLNPELAETKAFVHWMCANADQAMMNQPEKAWRKTDD